LNHQKGVETNLTMESLTTRFIFRGM